MKSKSGYGENPFQKLIQVDFPKDTNEIPEEWLDEHVLSELQIDLDLLTMDIPETRTELETYYEKLTYLVGLVSIKTGKHIQNQIFHSFKSTVDPKVLRKTLQFALSKLEEVEKKLDRIKN